MHLADGGAAGAAGGVRRAKLAEIDAKIADLQAMRGVLAAVVAAGCDSLTACSCQPDCPIPFADLATPAR